MNDSAQPSTTATSSTQVSSPQPQSSIFDWSSRLQQQRQRLQGQANSTQPPVTPAQSSTPMAGPDEEQNVQLFDRILTEVESARIPNQAEPQISVPQPTSSQPTPVASPTSPTPLAGTSQSDDLSILSQAWPSAVDQATDTLNPPIAGGSIAKEQLQGGVDTGVLEAGNIQTVEQERTPEISSEVEEFLQRVSDHTTQAPHEVVIADGTQENAQANYPSRPVIVLPITQDIEEAGAKKSPKFSIRWLVEWSHKIIKMFAGKVIYKVEPEAENA